MHPEYLNWTEETIHVLPEIKISVWAEKAEVVLDRLYATEERESGTMRWETTFPVTPASGSMSFRLLNGKP